MAIAIVAEGLNAQSARPITAVKRTKLLSSDSFTVRGPALSPDGRWVVFQAYAALNSWKGNLWIVPAAGGMAAPITTGQFVDNVPVWFPASDRILFQSSRVKGALMALRIDPKTGRAIGGPERITLEPSGIHFAVSPDGQHIAYAGGRALKIVPANGGAARTLVVADTGHFVTPQWTADGKFVEYILGRAMMRVPVAGGAPTSVLTFAGTGLVQRGPRTIATGVVAQGGGVHLGALSVLSLGGDTLARFEVPDLVGAPRQMIGLTNDPGTIVAASDAGVYATRVASVDGGAPRTIRAGSNDDWPIAWSADSKSVWVGTMLSPGRHAIVSVPAAGGAIKTVLEDSSFSLEVPTIDGRLVYYTPRAVPPNRSHSLRVFDVATKKSELIADSADVPFLDNSGNPMLSSRDEFAYIARRRNGVEFRVWSPVSRQSRVVRSVPAIIPMAAVHNDLLAYVTTNGDSSRLFVARGNGQEHEVRALQGAVRTLVWSGDGKTLSAMTTSFSTDANWRPEGDILFVDIDASGAPAGPVRAVAAPGQPSRQAWLPDGSGTIALVMNSKFQGNLYRIPARGTGAPVQIARGETGLIWDFVLSPDGKSVAYPAELQGPSVLWKIEIPGLSDRRK
jgi:Tol biopolymer transport system component